MREALTEDRFDEFVVDFYARQDLPVPPLEADPAEL